MPGGGRERHGKTPVVVAGTGDLVQEATITFRLPVPTLARRCQLLSG